MENFNGESRVFLQSSFKGEIITVMKNEKIFFIVNYISMMNDQRINEYFFTVVCLFAEIGYLAESQSLTETDYLKLTDDHDCFNTTFYFMDQNHHSQERAICSLFCDITCHWIMMLSPLSMCPDVSMHSVIRPQSL